MRLRWAVVFGVLMSSVAAAEPVAPCNSAAQCLDKGDIARFGRGVEPDRALALRAYEKACEGGEARGCMEAARLHQRGWMFEVERKPDKARELAMAAQRKTASCAQTDACAIGFEAQLMLLELAGWPEAMKATGARLATDADKLCATTAEACRWVRDNGYKLSDHTYVERTTIVQMRERAMTNVEAMCKKGTSAAACYWAGKWTLKNEAALKFNEPACKASFKDACWDYYEAKFETTKPADTPPLFKEALATLEPFCQTTPTKQCRELGEIFLLGSDEDGMKLAKDAAKGQQLIERTCMLGGDVRACETLGKIFHEGKLLPANPAKAQQFWSRGCRLSEPDDWCQLCEKFPKALECQRRSAWMSALGCEGGDEPSCARVGDTFRGKVPELRDHTRAAKYYRRACDAAVKTACASLDELCVTESDVEPALCQQSLIHSDVFYEAEWQYRQTGKTTMAGAGNSSEAAKSTDKVAGLDQGESNSGGGNGGFKRGSLDADLVVGIVLDRARQAAIQVVVDELRSSGSGRVAGYLRDLLTQAALLLGDRNTLRREKLTDLARTVVRALLASNLVNTLYPDPDALVSNAVYSEWAGKAWTPKWATSDKERLRRYLTDWAYHLLGQTKLFAGVSDELPHCPFAKDPGKQICTWLVDGKKPHHAHLARLLHLDSFVDGLALARVIRMEREVELRRLVEALGRSKTIANFSATPGLNLQVWERDLVDGVEARLRDLRDQIDALAKLADPATFTTPPPWTDMLAWGRTTRKFFVDRGAAALLSREQQTKLVELSRLITNAQPFNVAPGAENDEQRAARIAGEIVIKLNQWDATTRGDITARVVDLRRRITLVRPSLTALGRQIEEIRSAVRRLSRGGLSIDEIPLSGLPELNESLDGALGELKKLDEQLRAIFPGTRRTQVRFAISAVVRLRGFLSLMDRISRRAPLNQTVGELMSSVKMLGNVRKGRFSAPLFDVVEPVLDALTTHRPLDADVLFSMISRARLDSLVTSLESEGKRRPCERDEGGTECWTVKVIHALQESVQRDGDMIKVDGGQFARRLAVHGDDFRRKNKWGSFFHLTVGFGGMYSKGPPVMDTTGAFVDGKDRTVPVVAEQIGFGMASPTFARDTLKLKFGAFGSGILYRMVLDSTESNAVAMGGFLALDIHNYVELFVAPALLLYPPEGDRSVTPRLGVFAGLQVPLGAYLAKLTD